MELRIGSWWRITGSCRWNCAWAVGGESPEAADGTEHGQLVENKRKLQVELRAAHGQLMEKHRKQQMKLRMGSWWRSTGSCRWTWAVGGEAPEFADRTAHGQLVENRRKLQMEQHMYGVY